MPKSWVGKGGPATLYDGTAEIECLARNAHGHNGTAYTKEPEVTKFEPSHIYRGVCT